jgi:hypothetical protein
VIPQNPDSLGRCEIGLAYTLLWGACLHSNEEHRQIAMMHAREAYAGAVRYGGEFPYLEAALRELFEEIQNWSMDRRDEYRAKSLQWSAFNG